MKLQATNNFSLVYEITRLAAASRFQNLINTFEKWSLVDDIQKKWLLQLVTVFSLTFTNTKQLSLLTASPSTAKVDGINYRNTPHLFSFPSFQIFCLSASHNFCTRNKRLSIQFLKASHLYFPLSIFCRSSCFVLVFFFFLSALLSFVWLASVMFLK